MFQIRRIQIRLGKEGNIIHENCGITSHVFPVIEFRHYLDFFHVIFANISGSHIFSVFFSKYARNQREI